MRKFSCDPEVEIIGHGVLAFTDNLVSDQIQPILREHQLTDIMPDEWYPMSKLLDVLNDIAEHEANIASDYIAIGMQRAKTALMPPHVEQMSLSEFLDNWNTVYQAQHRGGDVGEVKAIRVSERHYEMAYDIIYPDDFIYGVAWGMAKRFLDQGTSFTVKYDEQTTRKDLGGQITKIHVEWGVKPLSFV